MRVSNQTGLPPIIAQAQLHDGRTAIVDSQGSFTYNDLLEMSSRVATALLAGCEDLQEERVAFLMTPGFPWVAVQWGIWRAGGVAVPLPLNSTKPELEYFIGDSGASILVFDAAAAPLLTQIAAARGVRTLVYEQISAGRGAQFPDIARNIYPDIANERRAMILYTSGTTSRPKGRGDNPWKYQRRKF